ncbi:cysteine--tRNA ligase [Candidatus Sumerlaeota bacterium]|nr:cysteine--tRNA ligase [Candidatus Sumerlaeota bacterium]
MKIYNTITRSKEEFKPLNPPNALMYNCGPTVYDYFHIGNARNFVVADTIRRYLEYRGFKVRFVQNITDIDDKIINRAKKEGVAAQEIATRFTRIFFEKCRLLGVRRADLHPKATETIPQMQELIKTLIKKKHAYVIDGDVYFSVRSFPSYGKLSGKNLEELQEGARVEVDARKKDPLDFALWKSAKPGEPSWESPWGPGRPGWHIECSAMVMAFLGESIDIHSGGVDLVFPHHENERAQSEAATGKPFVKYWVHNGYLNINSEKMSKSLGNFFTIDQVLERFDPLTLKFFLLSAHYRHPIDFNDENLKSAENAAKRVLDALETVEKLFTLEHVSISEKEAAEKVKDQWIMFRRYFDDAMDDDFNTAKALSILHDIVSAIHELRTGINEAKEDQDQKISHLAGVKLLRNLLLEMLEILGLDPALGKKSGVLEGEAVEPLIKILIDIREKARKEKAFSIADEVRNRLLEIGVVLEDHPQGTIWKNK